MSTAGAPLCLQTPIGFPPCTMARVLFVDDEQSNLDLFAFTFKNEFQILTAQSGEEALRLFEQFSDIACIVTDQRMLGMSGTELLALVRKSAPQTIRMILSAWHDGDILMEAVNEGFIYRYLLKPWDHREVRQVLRRATEKYFLRQERERLTLALEERNAVLVRQAQELEEANAALRAMVLQGATNHEAMAKRDFAEIQQRLSPLLRELRGTELNKRQRRLVGLIETLLQEPSTRTVADGLNPRPDISRTEAEVARLIREGCTTKDISLVLGISCRTVEGHRNRLRAKLGLTGKKASLRTML